MVKQWGGRFTVPTDALMERLGESVSFDSRLAPWDIRASIAHAEMLGIRAACPPSGSERLTDCDLHVTLEPCPMCAGAIAHARLRRLYYGADDPKGGGVAHGARVFSHPQCLWRPEIYDGLRATDAAALLRAFFAARR